MLADPANIQVAASGKRVSAVTSVPFCRTSSLIVAVEFTMYCIDSPHSPPVSAVIRKGPTQVPAAFTITGAGAEAVELSPPHPESSRAKNMEHVAIRRWLRRCTISEVIKVASVWRAARGLRSSP